MFSVNEKFQEKVIELREQAYIDMARLDHMQPNALSAYAYHRGKCHALDNVVAFIHSLQKKESEV